MRLPLAFLGILLTQSVFISAAEPCRVIHGRVDFYSGDGQVVHPQHIGTHHLFWLLDEKSQEMVFKYIPHKPGDEDHPKSLFGNFTVCPTAYKSGSAQFATLQQIAHPRVHSRDGNK